MPPVAAAITTYLVSVGVSAAVASLVAYAATSLLTSLAFSVISSAILPKPKSRGLDVTDQGRSEMIKQPIVPRRTLYGDVVVSGAVVYIESYGADVRPNAYLSVILALAGHECDAIAGYWFDDTPVAFDPAGPITTPRYVYNLDGTDFGTEAPYAWMYPHLGAADQAADPVLMAASGKWTAAHRLRGVTYLHAKFRYGPGAYPDGLPKLRARVRGKKLYDPRTGLTVWSRNPALVLRDYLQDRLGVADAEFNDATIVAAANVCDEEVPRLNDGPEARYRCNGIVEDGQRPADVVEGVLSSMAGTLVYTGGKFEIHAGAAGSASVELDEDDLAGGIEVAPRLSRSQIFNAVKAVYVDPAQDSKAVTAPAVTNASYEAQDGGQRIWKNLELPFTDSPTMAQRLAKIELERVRQQITVTARWKPAALRLKVWDVVNLTNARFGWASKPFRVTAWSVNPDLSVNMTLREEASSMWSWSLEETVVDAAPDTNLPSGFAVDRPGLSIAEDLIVTASGGVLARLLVTVTPPDDAFVLTQDVDYRKSGEAAWTTLASAAAVGSTLVVVGVEDGSTYEVRARVRNALGMPSFFAPRSHTVVGQTARPGDVQNFSINIIGSTAYAAWDPELAVDLSHYRLRFSPATTGATWDTAFDYVERVGRQATSIAVPALVGSYLIKAVDLKGNESENAAIVTSTVAGIEGLNVVETVTEDPGFTGAKTDVVLDGASLILDGGGILFDSLAGDFDALVGNFDNLGGVATEGTYLFATTVDLGAVYTSRLTASLAIQVREYATTFDDFTGAFDDLDGNFDDLSPARDVGARLQVRTTEDDPSGTPTWSAWRDFVVGDYTARAFEFRLILFSNTDHASPEVTALSVTIDMPDRVAAGDDIVADSAGEAVTFAPAFKALHGLAISAQGLATGDYYSLTSKTATGFTIRFFNSGGTGISRTFDYVAKGYGVAA